MNQVSPDFHAAFLLATVPPPDNYERALQRERLDASILRALGERRALRATRMNEPSSVWDELERHVARAATMLWEVPASFTAGDDLLAYCAFLARELEMTESLDLTAEGERSRLEELAARAIEALDAIGSDLVLPRSESNPIKRALATAFGAIRAHLVAACRLEWNRAA